MLIETRHTTMTELSLNHPSTTATTRKRRTLIPSASCFALAVLLLLLGACGCFVSAFQPSRQVPGALYHRSPSTNTYTNTNVHTHTRLRMAQVSQQDAQKAIDTVVKALRSDAAAKKELGNLNKVENVLGYGSPQKGKLAVRFNASFKKVGSGFMGFPALGGKKDDTSKGNNKKSAGSQRGTMVGQVKASVDQATGKVVECSVFRDLGYGRSFNLKTR